MKTVSTCRNTITGTGEVAGTVTRVDDDDVRKSVGGVPLSKRERDLVDQARGDVPMGRWFREAVLQRLERAGYDISDDARRPAPRRANYEQQREDEGR